MERLPYDVEDAGMMEDATPAEEMAARDLFDLTVLPLLESYCVSCHGEGGASIGYRFLKAEPDIYTSVTSWPALVIPSDPTSSRILLDGEHPGTAWTGAQADTVVAWLEREADEYDGSGVEADLTTAAGLLAPGPNSWDLDVIGLAGATLSLRAEPTAAGWWLHDIEVNAGSEGARLVEPHVIFWVDGVPSPDAPNRFRDIEVAVEPFDRAPVGAGMELLDPIAFPEGASLSWHFEGAAPFVDTGLGGDDDAGVPLPTGGCMNVTTFTASVRPQLTTYCTSCHAGGNPDAQAAVDMSNVADAAEMAQRLGCGEILSRSRGATPSILAAPNAASGLAHPFRLTAAQMTGFSSAILDWVATEAP